MNADDFAKCPECGYKYPCELVISWNYNGAYIETCPICALAMRNALHGLPHDEPFTGTQASRLYDEAMEYAKKHNYKVLGGAECQESI